MQYSVGRLRLETDSFGPVVSNADDCAVLAVPEIDNRGFMVLDIGDLVELTRAT